MRYSHASFHLVCFGSPVGTLFTGGTFLKFDGGLWCGGGGRTLVDASSWSASVLMVNPNAEEIVLPSFAFVGDLVPVSAVSVALADPALPGDMCAVLPDHLEDIVTGSHPSLGEAGQLLLRELLHQYGHVFPAPGEPVTGRTTSVHHEILTSDARPVRCGPRRLC